MILEQRKCISSQFHANNTAHWLHLLPRFDIYIRIPMLISAFVFLLISLCARLDKRFDFSKSIVHLLYGGLSKDCFKDAEKWKKFQNLEAEKSSLLW